MSNAVTIITSLNRGPSSNTDNIARYYLSRDALNAMVAIGEQSPEELFRLIKLAQEMRGPDGRKSKKVL